MKISYTVTRDFNITVAEAQLIRGLYSVNEDGLANKFIKEQYADLSLYESKKICEAVNNTKQ